MESMLNREWRGAIVSVATDSTGVGFLRRKTNPFMERKENHMIIARAAKGAALLLMIFGVVAFIGCQATATPGKDGEPGAKGDTGDRGPQGPAGISALQAKGGSDTHNILINNTADDDDNFTQLGDLTSPTSGSLVVADLFVGGKPPVTYEAGEVSPSTGTAFKVTVEGGKIVINKASDGTKTPESDDYGTGATFTITATDADDVSVTKDVAVKANRAPRIRASLDLDSTGVVSGSGYPIGASEMNIVLGTQEEIPAQGAVLKKQAWNTAATKGSAWSYGVRDTVANMGDANYLFEDEDPRDVKVTIGEIGAEGDSDDEEHFKVTIDGRNLSFTGLKSTYDEDDSKHKPIPVELVATDAGGLSDKKPIHVWVDQAPVLDTSQGEPPSRVTARRSDGAVVAIGNVADFFKDPEGVTGQTISDVTSSASGIATAELNGDNLEVTGVNPGTATIRFLYGSDGSGSPFNHASILALAMDRDGDGTVDADDGDLSAADAGELPAAQYAVGTITVTVIP